MSILSIGQKKNLKIKVAAHAIHGAATFYKNNRKLTNDFLKFNLFNGDKTPPKQCKRINHVDLPTEIKKWLNQIRNAKFRAADSRYVFTALGTKPTITNRESPLSGKWVYEYVKKYGWSYKPYQKVTVNELLKKLTAEELQVYCRLIP